MRPFLTLMLPPLAFQAGTLEPLADLPGMPDNISSAPDGSFWVALFSPNVDAALLIAPVKLLRTFLSFVPSDLLPKVALALPLSCPPLPLYREASPSRSRSKSCPFGPLNNSRCPASATEPPPSSPQTQAKAEGSVVHISKDGEVNCPTNNNIITITGGKREPRMGRG